MVKLWNERFNYQTLLSWKKLISYFLTIIILLLIFSQIDFYFLCQIFSRINFLYLFLATGSALLAQLGVAYIKWDWVIRGMGNFIPYNITFSIWVSSYCFKNLLPFKLGEFLRIHYLKKKHLIPWQKGIFPSLFNMFSDFIILCLFSIVGLLSLPDIKFKTDNVFIGTLVLLLILTLILWRKKNTLSEEWGKFYYRFSFHKFMDAWRNFTLLKRIILYLYSGIFVLLEMLVYYFIFRSLKVNIRPTVIFSFLPIVILISLLPVTISGIGSRELGLITLFLAYSEPELLLGVGILVSFVGYLLPAILSLFFANYFLENIL